MYEIYILDQFSYEYEYMNRLSRRLFTTFMEERAIESWKGYALALLIILQTIISNFLLQHAEYIASRVSVRVRSALVDTVYRKSLRLASGVSTETSKRKLNGRPAAGDFENFIASDMQRIQVKTITCYRIILYYTCTLDR